ncbi:MAG: GNAT family N-acetyltransferase [Leptolyngbya sp. SIO1D8]|nr:GNAT family N-acetyltransferase [Leptolyngbya sp. SIO1D8]
MITLRDYEKSDIARLVLLANNKNVSRYLIDTFPYPYTDKDAEWWLETGNTASNTVTKVIQQNDEFVGSVGITPQIGWRQHVAEIGYWIGEAYWGQGITTEALRLMTDDALFSLGYHKLFAPVLGPNKASMRVLEKCGYELEGILKQEVYKDGQYFDIHHYAKRC